MSRNHAPPSKVIMRKCNPNHYLTEVFYVVCPSGIAVPNCPIWRTASADQAGKSRLRADVANATCFFFSFVACLSVS